MRAPLTLSDLPPNEERPRQRLGSTDHRANMQNLTVLLAWMRGFGRKPCSATPSGKLKSKRIRAPPPGGFPYFSVLLT